MILKLKWRSSDDNADAPYLRNMAHETGGTIYEENDSIFINAPDGQAWRLARSHWKPQNCVHADYKTKTIASQIHYSRMHTVWEEYPDLIFKPTGLPDEYEDYTYYMICREACGNCEDQLGPHILTGPTTGMFSL